MLVVKKIVAISFLMLVFCTSINSLPRAKASSFHTFPNRVVQATVKTSDLLATNYLMDMIDDDLSNENQLVFSTTNSSDDFSTLILPVSCTGNSPISPEFHKTKFTLSETPFLMNFRI